MKRTFLLLLLFAAGSVRALAGGVVAPSALLGQTFSWQYYAYGSLYQGSTQFVDNGGTAGNFEEEFNILADNNSISFQYLEDGSWSPSALSLPPTISNGIAINSVNGPLFTNVTLDPLTNMVGFDDTRFSFTSSQIQVDWADLSFTPSTVVKFDVNSAAIPEPSTYGLLLGGLALGAAGVRRQEWRAQILS